ncbi:uncharacterized protein TNCV_573051 [Trichonephila clavipes]|nr:uncharacterized protein TNCV_573051 [Trichonephila clavipes]
MWRFSNREEGGKAAELLNAVMLCCNIAFKSFFTIEKINGKIVLDGVEGKMLECLAEKLNFEFEIFLPFGGGSANSNGTWDGVIGLVQSGEADMGLGSLTISEDRLKAVDFSVEYSTLKKLFVIKEPSQMPKITAFSYPFTRNAWILYVLMVLAATVLFQRIMFKNATLCRHWRASFHKP